MTDLWADVRERTKEKPRGPWGTIAQEEIERLLTDADAMYALLALMDIPGLSSWASNTLADEDAGEHRRKAAEKILEAIHTLPEHVRTSL